MKDRQGLHKLFEVNYILFLLLYLFILSVLLNLIPTTRGREDFTNPLTQWVFVDLRHRHQIRDCHIASLEVIQSNKPLIYPFDLLRCELSLCT